LELLRHRVGFTQQLLVGKAPDAPPGDHQIGIADGIAPLCAPRAVSGRAVGLDDQALLAPDEVTLVALDVHVHLGAGEVVPVAEGQEDLLELAAGAGASGRVNCKH